MKHLISIESLSKNDLLDFISLAQKIKKSPGKYRAKLKNKVLLDLFEKPSLRTRLSIEDTSRVISRYVDIIMARLYSQENLVKLANNGNVPVINGLTDYEHPCQILADLLTIKEKLKRLTSLKLVYIGDAKNNVTHSLMFACSKLGIKMSIACPKSMHPLVHVKGIEITQDINKAIKNANILYTDSWMSYQIPKSQHAKRVKLLKRYQINETLMKKVPNALFMHCLPAKRGEEVTTGVMDSKRSIVFDQAENRLHIQKAILLKLL